MREIKVDFIITTNQMSMEELANVIDIRPCYCQTTFPRGSVAEPYWYIEERSTSLSVEEPLEQIKDRLSPKTIVIKDICEQLHIKPSVYISVTCDYSDRPEIVLSSEILKFYALLDAEIGFDIAYEW